MTALFYPPSVNGLQKTLGSALNEGETSSVTLNNATSIQNKPGVFVVDRIDTNGDEKAAADREYITYTAVSGSTLTGLTRGLGGSTDQDHGVGAVVEFIPDVVWAQAIIDALANLVDETDISVINTTNIVTPTGSQTLTNKTINGATLSGTISGNATLPGAIDFAGEVTHKQRKGHVNVIGNLGSYYNLDFSAGETQTANLNTTCTLSLINVEAGDYLTLMLYVPTLASGSTLTLNNATLSHFSSDGTSVKNTGNTNNSLGFRAETSSKIKVYVSNEVLDTVLTS